MPVPIPERPQVRSRAGVLPVAVPVLLGLLSVVALGSGYSTDMQLLQGVGVGLGLGQHGLGQRGLGAFHRWRLRNRTPLRVLTDADIVSVSRGWLVMQFFKKLKKNKKKNG